MDCEVKEILEGAQDHLLVSSKDPEIKMPESFNKALQHSKYGSRYIDVQSVRQVLDTLKTNGVTDGKICMIGNILLESINEVYILVPPLKDNSDNNEGLTKDALRRLTWQSIETQNNPC
ncbi:DNA-directed RNA polymerases IV and V subunit 4-like [Dioscorea cayenensis subsp. rotundata]|uniref:DNA-directed RNA polymerases IV and V subunit 4-like n=1 Tax=Dioscorea cayennensis subsp. rotundata TaxID=55577 RepID=A0AB40AXZ7_DIOCR|nr:DNA-directed RNA polymerases IV and V subunit 4-like [Dioscorea cayenensis subsp. rotundata]